MDVWMKPEPNPQTGKDYYAYVIVYVDDLIHIYHNTKVFIKELKVVYSLKYSILGLPTQY